MTYFLWFWRVAFTFILRLGSLVPLLAVVQNRAYRFQLTGSQEIRAAFPRCMISLSVLDAQLSRQRDIGSMCRQTIACFTAKSAVTFL